MVGDSDSGEIVFGLTLCGGYQIILRPGKWFFFNKFLKFIWSIFDMLNVKRLGKDFFFCNFSLK